MVQKIFDFNGRQTSGTKRYPVNPDAAVGCEYARNFDATPEAAQRIDLVRKGQNVVGSCFARNVTPKKWIHPNNQ